MQNVISAGLKNFFSSDIMDLLVTHLGDEPGQIESAFDAVTATLTNAIADKGSSSSGAEEIQRDIVVANDGNVLSHVHQIFSGGGEWIHKGGQYVQSLLGGKEHTVSREIANATGAKQSSVASLMAMLAPLIMGLIGKSGNQDRRGLLTTLMGLVPGLAALLPSGLSFSRLGLKSEADLTQGLQNSLAGFSATNHHNYEKQEKKSGAGWLVPLLLVLGLIAFAIWFFGRDKTAAVDTTLVDSTEVTTTTVVTDTVRKAVILPDGTNLPFSKGSMEFKLVEFLNDPNRSAGKDVWFDFDDVSFDMGSSRITEESGIQLSNIASIFKQYPKLKAKVGGYTDKTGDEALNLKLSQERAEAVHKALVERGVAESQLEGAEGYGSKFATVAAEATDAERRVDRKMALSIREK